MMATCCSLDQLLAPALLARPLVCWGGHPASVSLPLKNIALKRELVALLTQHERDV